LLKSYLFCILFVVNAFYGKAQTNDFKGKAQDSLLLVYSFKPTQRNQIENLLAEHYKEHKDLETKAFLDFLVFAKGIDDKSLEELNQFDNEVSTKYTAFPNVQARAFRTIAYHYFISLGNYERAFDVYLKLEKLLKLYDDNVITNYADYCAEIATAYFKFKNYKTAIEIGKLALSKAGNKWYMFNSIGLCYIELRDLELATKYLKQAVLEAENHKMANIYRTIALGNIGYVHYLKGEFKQAKPLFNLDLKEALKQNDLGLAAGAAIPLSDILISERKYTEAYKLLGETRTYIAKSGQLDRLEKFFPIKSKYYEVLGIHNQALAYRDSSIKAIVRNDSVFNGLLVMRAQQRMDLERIAVEKNKLQSYKKLAEIRTIALVAVFIIGVVFYLSVRKYRNRIETDKKRIAELNRIMELRQGLSADMHDDIGSTLSSISIYTHSLLMKSENEDNKAVLEKIKVNAQNIQENISDIIWSVNPKMDSMRQAIARMRLFGADITEYAGIQFTFSVDDDVADLPLDMLSRKNLYLIYKEAVNNAVKYSNCHKINIHLSQSNGVFTMVIEDDGVGIKMDGTSRVGNGITNMKERAHFIGATLTISSASGNGTRLTLIIKKP
jgi:signal transduction histidine kinase